MKRLREEDEGAFAFLFDTYAKSLYFYCHSILRDGMFAKDVVQESFEGLWERRKGFESLRSIRVFLYQTARNKCLDLLKHEEVVRRHEPMLARELSEDFLAEKMVEEEMLGEIYRAVEELPPECRKVFKMSLEGMSNGEIAAALSVSVHTVKSQKQRAMNVLRGRLGKDAMLLIAGVLELFY